MLARFPHSLCGTAPVTGASSLRVQEAQQLECSPEGFVSETGMSRRSSRTTPPDEEEGVGEQGEGEASRVLAAVEALTTHQRSYSRC